MSGLTGRKINDLYRRRVLTADECANQVIDLAAENDCSLVIEPLCYELREQVREKLGRAPVTDDEWNKTISIFGGSCVPGHAHDAAIAKHDAQYRAGVEALRAYFAQI